MAQPKQQEAPVFTIEWGDMKGVPLVVGDIMHWRTTADRCYVTVGQMNLPVTDGPIPEGSAIDVEPVVRIMIPKDSVQVWAALFAQAASQFAGEPKTGEPKK